MTQGSKALFAAAVLALGAALPVGAALAQTSTEPLMARGDATLNHVDLLVSDVGANQKFWVMMGGTPAHWGSGPDAALGVMFGKVGIVLRKADNVGPAIGSGINHIGLYVPNVQRAIAGWKAAGLKTEAGRNPQQSFVWSPNDLIRIEILEMPDQAAAVTFHHVHYFVHANSAGGVAQMQAWYARLFGAMPGKRAQFEIDNIPGGELTFADSASPTAPTASHAVDHIALTIKGLAVYCRKLEAGGVKLDTPCARPGDPGLEQVFLTDPWGDGIELDEAH